MESTKEKELTACLSCGEKIRIHEAYEFGGACFCNKNCLSDYNTCRICKELHKIDNMRYDTQNNDYVCDDCYDNEYLHVCHDCGEITYDIQLVSYEHKIVCQDCADSNYILCDDCKEYYSEDNIHSDEYGHHLCNECYNVEYCTCQNCEEIVHVDNIYVVENREYSNYYCQDCYIEFTNRLHDYSYKPTPLFFHSTDERRVRTTNFLFMGVELEVDNGSSIGESVKYIQSDCDWIYCKEDSSLSNGIEIVTHPCTLKFHMEQKYESLFDWLTKKEWKSEDTSTCGLHVHINKDYLGSTIEVQDLNIAKIMLIMDRLWNKGIVNFTRRKNEELNRWAKRCTIEGIEYESLSGKDIINKSKVYKEGDRYYALNLNNKDTIEFRLFKGTLKYTTFIGTLQFISNLVHYAKDKTLIEIQQSNIKISDIIKYNEYEELMQYAKEKDLI